jgi:hypothetical protein
MTKDQENELKEIWQRWIKQAAEERGVTVHEITERLKNGEAVMEIKCTLPPHAK